MKKIATALLCCILGLNVFSQIEMEKKGDGILLYLDKGHKELAWLPMKDFVTLDKNAHSVVTNFDEIEHHWVVRGLIEGKDSVKFIAAFYKLSKKDTLIFTVGLSDTTVRAATVKFNYLHGSAYKPLTIGKSKNLKGRESFTHTPGNKAYTGNYFYTDALSGMEIENKVETTWNFKSNDFYTIRVEQLPIHGRLFYSGK